MVVNSGELFPETAGVILLRWAWRYRSELALLGFTAVIMCPDLCCWRRREKAHDVSCITRTPNG